MTDTPIIAAREPVKIDVKQGETYWWCQCGKSKTQPFCDGAHQGTSFAPMEYTATKDQPVFFCQCKQSARVPLCDGAHSKL